MEAKIYILCLLPILFVAYSDAIDCHVCVYVDAEVAAQSVEVGDDCKDVDDVKTVSCTGACTKMDFTVKGDSATGHDFNIRYLIRGCADDLEGRDSDKCYDIDEFFSAQQLEDIIRKENPALGSFSVDSAEGDACLCDDDKCNSANSFTAGVVIVFATLVGYLMKN